MPDYRKYINFILTRTFVLYLACFLVIWHILDYHQLYNNALLQTMSRLTPPIDYYDEFVDKNDHFNRFQLMNCINYHHKVAHFFAYQKPEAYGMLGFCYERSGQQSQAEAAYQKAIALNQDYFWPYYNLGVMAYQQAQYSKAGDYFTKAIGLDPIRTIVLLSRSKVYNDVNLSRRKGPPSDYLQGLKQGRLEAYILLLDSLYKTGSFAELLKTSIEGIKEGFDVQGITYYYAGLSCYYQKSYKQAIEFFQVALQNDPQNADAMMYMGMCLKMADKPEIAQIFINKAAQLHQQGVDELKTYLSPRVRFF